MRVFNMKCFFVTIGYIALCFTSPPGFSFGTLMTTPEQRLIIDRYRDGAPLPNKIRSRVARSEQKKVVSLNGLVKRKYGPNMIWVNGRFVVTPDIEGVSIDANKLVNKSIVVKSSDNNMILLKPGQRLTLLDGNIDENYNTGHQVPVIDNSAQNNGNTNDANVEDTVENMNAKSEIVDIGDAE